MTDRHHLSRLLKPKELNLAIETFNKIIVHFDASQTNDSGYKPATLIDLMRNEVFEKDDFLGLFFAYIQQGLLDESRGTDLDPILSHLAGFCI
ncbi:hypothetical protein ANOM_006867 [Aspergillus nomiae NRRL 13137]|uniref:Uncharacterized protein n=1 Tax=Aspergillus nomiae NRRL (strain ATCC 15546 / NRRL 13137 / CBS 260.88 / M93) TaxID=1509407 RepID=A0A0L1IZD0_ASPN3|nr:uncharacterized protein ANOM_006867 [Aspergillus nomiae NRRL 13137]KNG84874.1 hypothetical protein ANOM_006867 [Aspergillus nomiae NRRL 13137]